MLMYLIFIIITNVNISYIYYKDMSIYIMKIYMNIFYIYKRLNIAYIYIYIYIIKTFVNISCIY